MVLDKTGSFLTYINFKKSLKKGSNSAFTVYNRLSKKQLEKKIQYMFYME